MKRNLILITGLVVLATGCNKGQKSQEQPKVSPPAVTTKTTEPTVIRYEYASDEITKICKDQMKLTDERLAAMLKVPSAEKNFSNTIETFETILADLSEMVSPVTFIYSVHQDKNIRAEAEKCDSELGQYIVGLFTRRDLYDALVEADNSKKSVKTKQKHFVLCNTLPDSRENPFYYL